eukprot:scaffold48_cov311-Pinguiococcus_pyrenoidosus.AAC.58
MPTENDVSVVAAEVRSVDTGGFQEDATREAAAVHLATLRFAVAAEDDVKDAHFGAVKTFECQKIRRASLQHLHDLLRRNLTLSLSPLVSSPPLHTPLRQLSAPQRLNRARRVSPAPDVLPALSRHLASQMASNHCLNGDSSVAFSALSPRAASRQEPATDALELLRVREAPKRSRLAPAQEAPKASLHGARGSLATSTPSCALCRSNLGAAANHALPSAKAAEDPLDDAGALISSFASQAPAEPEVDDDVGVELFGARIRPEATQAEDAEVAPLHVLQFLQAPQMLCRCSLHQLLFHSRACGVAAKGCLKSRCCHSSSLLDAAIGSGSPQQRQCAQIAAPPPLYGRCTPLAEESSQPPGCGEQSPPWPWRLAASGACAPDASLWLPERPSPPPSASSAAQSAPVRKSSALHRRRCNTSASKSPLDSGRVRFDGYSPLGYWYPALLAILGICEEFRDSPNTRRGSRRP